jgi:hypothetical protein
VVVDHTVSNLTLSLVSESDSVAVPGAPVTILVSMVTASRKDVFLEVDFGSGAGDVQTISIEDTNSTMMNNNSDQGQWGALDKAFLASSYDEVCDLSFKFKHAFHRQGVYYPTARLITTNGANMSTDGSVEIVVINVLSGARLQSDNMVVAVKKPTSFSLNFLTSSVNMSIEWVVRYSDGAVLDNATSSIPRMSYTFPYPGSYVVNATAHNVVSSTRASTNIVVQVPVTELTMSCSPGPWLLVGERLSCAAAVAGGTELTFIWNFQHGNTYKPVLNVNGTSTATHQFFWPGPYNVSIMAYNKVSRVIQYVPESIVVRRQITQVSLQTTAPTVLGNHTYFKAEVRHTSGVVFDFDFGAGRHHRAGEFSLESRNLFYTDYIFTAPGRHSVTVFAHNGVSEARQTIYLLIEEPVRRRLDLVALGAPVVMAPAVFMLQPIGKYRGGKHTTHHHK